MRGIQSEALIAVEWLLLGIALFLIIARLNLRLNHLKAGFVISDAFILAAFAAGVSLNAVDITLYRRGVYEADVGFQMLEWKATEQEKVLVWRTQYFLYIPFYLQQYFNKGTLLALYYEIFGQRCTNIRLSLTILSFYCVIGFITTMSMVLFRCQWGCYWSYDDICPSNCWAVNDSLAWAFHFSSDIAIFILPVVCISKLNMSRAQRISASVTFLIGFINISITLARWIVVQSVFTPEPALNTGEALAIADGHTGLIVSILPSLRPYLRIWQTKPHHPAFPPDSERLDSVPSETHRPLQEMTSCRKSNSQTALVDSA
ncbi:hypothetical protein B0J13DRAFT_588680 [Dactylonectria estremocensis]|uniref:Rhodopsin domain-containing protein n=1 Tax=Dactylonectria estremocensis TaxID=1079267 RepID=A0A9P9DX75_9HYPO|nr:hypothetical protein B0J13DRAFT_588680 [Dactylonectria estremocensis]